MCPTGLVLKAQEMYSTYPTHRNKHRSWTNEEEDECISNNKTPEELNEAEISNLSQVQGTDHKAVQQMYEKNERK